MAKYPNPQAEYIQSPVIISLRQVAEKWHMSFQALRQEANRKKWVEKRKRFQERLSQRVADAVVEEATEAIIEGIDAELDDVKALRADLLERLLPERILNDEMADMLRVTYKPRDMAILVQAFVAVDKQLCLRRAGMGGADSIAPLTVNIVPLNGTGRVEENA